MKFDARRFDEFESLGDLLEEVKSLDRGSGFLERVARCIERAEQLTATDWEARPLRPSFRQWLHDELCQQHEQFIQEQAEQNK